MRTLLYQEQGALVKRDKTVSPHGLTGKTLGDKVSRLRILSSGHLLGLPLAEPNQKPKGWEPVDPCHAGQPPG